MKILIACEESQTACLEFRKLGGVNRGQKHQRGVVKNQKEASKTFTGIAKAMAEQWGEFILKGEGK